MQQAGQQAEQHLQLGRSTQAQTKQAKRRQQRVVKEMRELLNGVQQMHPAFDLYPCEEDLTHWRIVLQGPAG
jgi:hypothetical protein